LQWLSLLRICFHIWMAVVLRRCLRSSGGVTWVTAKHLSCHRVRSAHVAGHLQTLCGDQTAVRIRCRHASERRFNLLGALLCSAL